MKKIKVNCINTSTSKNVEFGTTLQELIEIFKPELKYPILGAYVNNCLKDLSYMVSGFIDVEFFDITIPDGMRMYIRSLNFVLYKAVKDVLHKEANLHILHAVSKGFYCEIREISSRRPMAEIVRSVKKRMKEIIKEDLEFIKYKTKTEKAIKIFSKEGLDDKKLLLSQRKRIYTSVYKMDGVTNYLHGNLVPSTGYLKTFNLVNYYDGMLLQVPSISDPSKTEKKVKQRQLFEVFKEHKSWLQLLNIENVGKLNQYIENKDEGTLIKIDEALHSKKIAKIADKIISSRSKINVVLISGPSASGKTTFSKRLSIQFQIEGLKPVIISLDNYFVNRDKTPIDENGEYDFESLDALDIKLFNKHLVELIKGKKVTVPRFDFHHGMRQINGDELQLEDNSIIIIEGIHGLNPKLTPSVENRNKYKIYVSALTQVSIDRHNRINTTDNRLLRRMIRDHNYRNHSALQTLKRWPSVRAGEEKNIFPYQEEADIMFNSSLLYEFCVLKSMAEPLIKAIPENVKEYAEALRLLKFLSFFLPISKEQIPQTSLLREFIGGSSYEY
ncbi:MAG: nucleoside kinase [Candidatus Delongbacteria bacterium]|jgi:uridine kinase|nr:nucleoside kinase [Candidatus Delongbacteria bacterium]